jgi:TPP-dependent 2-oxoacid decarboxylase
MTKQLPKTDTSAVNVADYIVERLAAEGIDHCFGVAGDYVFPICDAVESSAKVKWIGCSNELNASYAADGYARIRGAAMLATTYGVGELSAINGVMGAKAERSLVFHVVGMPSYQHQRLHKIAHHTLGDGASSAISSNCPPAPRAVMRSSIRRTVSSKWSASSRRRAATISLPISQCRRTTRYPQSSQLT